MQESGKAAVIPINTSMNDDEINNAKYESTHSNVKRVNYHTEAALRERKSEILLV